MVEISQENLIIAQKIKEKFTNNDINLNKKE